MQPVVSKKQMRQQMKADENVTYWVDDEIEELNFKAITDETSFYLNENGEFIRPTKPNAYKFETLILDMIYMMDDCLSFEVDRSKEFAPVKNATGVDSVESARELLTQNGIEI